MENPETWNLVVASLAVWDLEADPRGAWAFLVVQGLVRDDDRTLATFLRLVKEEVAQGPITGPSVAFRVAGGLRAAGVVLPGSVPADPWGKTAQARRDLLKTWRPA